MNPRLRAWLLIGILAVVCILSVGGVAWYRARPLSPGLLLKIMPTQDAVVLYIDFAALRRGGILQLLEGSKASEDPDYQAFVERINFDYREDLDSALVTFAPSGKFMLVKGRFDWKRLHSYAIESGGRCVVATCRMAGSAPDRRISFFPVQSGLLALAVSTDDSAVVALTERPSGKPEEVPNAPIWLRIPGSFLKSPGNLPTGTRMFTHGMEEADHLTFTFVPEGRSLAATLEIRCNDEEHAVRIASQLASATLTLRQMLEREHTTPDPGDPAAVLSSGTFRSEGKTVFGHWPLDRSFIEHLIGVS